jgi:hypothetical protein
VERSGADDVQGETEVLSVGTDSWAEIETAEGFRCWWSGRTEEGGVVHTVDTGWR